MRNKRAVSAVVATVLIILITIAAVTILWAAVIPMIKEKISSGTLCLDAVSQISLVTVQGYTCIKQPRNLSVQVGRGPEDFDLVDIQIIVSAGGDTTSFSMVDLMVDLPGLNEEKVVVFDTGLTNIDKVEIAPIVKVANTEKTCEICSTVETLSDCTV